MPCTVQPASAQQPAERPPERPAAAAQPQGSVLRLLPPDAVSEKEMEIGGRKLAYTATAGTLSLYGQDGERTAARHGRVVRPSA